MNMKLTAVALVALAGGVAAGVAFFGAPLARPTAGEVVASGKPLVGGPFSLIDTSGRRVTDQDFRGKYLLVFFGYTYCPDVCPAGLAVISAALDQLGPDGAKITPVLITIDPARDTPQKLADYVKSFHPRLVGLTGTPEEIASATKAYRVYAKKVPDERDPNAYTVDHSSIVYLMGPNGGLVAFSAELANADKLAAQLRKGLAHNG